MSVAPFNTAQEYVASHDYAAAANLFREYVKEHESDAQAWVELGSVLLKLQEFYEAIEAYATAYDLEPENPKYMGYLGDALLTVHEYEEAKALFEKAAIISGDLRYQIRVGDTLAYQKQFDKALVLYSLLSTNYPDDPSILNRMVKVYEALGRFEDAKNTRTREMEVRENIVKANPTANDWLKYADTKAHLFLWEEAEDAFRKSLALEETAEIHMRLGATLVMEKRVEEGIAEFEKAADIGKNDFSFLMMQADVLTRIEQYEESIKCYTKALNLRSVHADAWAGIAYDLLKMGEIDDAKAFFEMAKASASVRELPWADKLHKSEKTKVLDAVLKE